MKIPAITGVIRRRILLNSRVAPEVAQTCLPENFHPKVVEGFAIAGFEAGCVGYSSRPDSRTLDGLRLRIPDWRVAPLWVDSVRSAYFDDRTRFREGSIELDHALLMRDVAHEWHSEPAMKARAVPEEGRR